MSNSDPKRDPDSKSKSTPSRVLASSDSPRPELDVNSKAWKLLGENLVEGAEVSGVLKEGSPTNHRTARSKANDTKHKTLRLKDFESTEEESDTKHVLIDLEKIEPGKGMFDKHSFNQGADQGIDTFVLPINTEILPAYVLYPNQLKDYPLSRRSRKVADQVLPNPSVQKMAAKANPFTSHLASL